MAPFNHCLPFNLLIIDYSCLITFYWAGPLFSNNVQENDCSIKISQSFELVNLGYQLKQIQ